MATVKLYGNLRGLVPDYAMQIDAPVISDLLRILVTEHEALEDALFDENGLRPHIKIMVNGHDIQLSAGFETPVHEDDLVAISQGNAIKFC